MTDQDEQGGALALRQEGALAPSEGIGSIVSGIMEAARDQSIDAAKVTAMKDLAVTMMEQRRIERAEELLARFNRDFNAAIMDMPVVTRAGIITIPGKDGNPDRTQGRFARFEDIDRVVRPILRKHNLALRFEVGEVGQTVSVRPVISHANGHTERGEAMRVPLDSSGAKNNTQGAGSAVTYGKRYTMCAFLNIVTEGTDDDGSLGKHEIGMPHEREVTVLEQAEEASRAGTYADYFKGQSPKDRAWLVTSGHHSRLGGSSDASGATLLAGPTAAAAPPSPPPAGDPPRRTAKAWTEDYERLCRDASSVEELMTVQSDAAGDIERLKKANPALHERAVQAGTDALARLRGNDL